MKKLKPYKGYTATVEFDADEMLLHGRLDRIRDVVSFHATSVDDLHAEFVAAVDDYLAFCRERNEVPDRPYSGRFVVRMEPEMHRSLAVAASADRLSINTWLLRLISDALETPSGESQRDGEPGAASARRDGWSPRRSGRAGTALPVPATLRGTPNRKSAGSASDKQAIPAKE